MACIVVCFSSSSSSNNIILKCFSYGKLYSAVWRCFCHYPWFLFHLPGKVAAFLNILWEFFLVWLEKHFSSFVNLQMLLLSSWESHRNESVVHPFQVFFKKADFYQEPGFVCSLISLRCFFRFTSILQPGHGSYFIFYNIIQNPVCASLV